MSSYTYGLNPPLVMTPLFNETLLINLAYPNRTDIYPFIEVKLSKAIYKRRHVSGILVGGETCTPRLKD